MVETATSPQTPSRGDIDSALDAANKLKDETLSFMRAAEKADNLFIRQKNDQSEGYAETPFGKVLVAARDSVDKLTFLISSLNTLRRNHEKMTAGDYQKVQDEIARAKSALNGFGPPPQSDADDNDDED